MKAAPTLSLIPLLAAAALAGCAGTEASSTSGLDKRPDIVTRQMPYKAGTGVVQSWAAASGTDMLRLGIRMDDGTMQYVDTVSRDFPVGSRVQLAEDRTIRRP